MENTYKIVIVDDHNIIIDGLTLLLSLEKNLEVIQTYNDGHLLLQHFRNEALKPDMVLMDLMMPNINGLDLSKILKTEFPEIKIIILSMSSEAKIINELINKTGVEGYLNKSVSRKELAECINLVKNGYIYLSAEANEALDTYREKLIQNDLIKLSAREKEIVRLMMDGHTNKEIAAHLFISENTVETHRKNIYRKTDTHSLPKLIQLVNELDLLSDAL